MVKVVCWWCNTTVTDMEWPKSAPIPKPEGNVLLNMVPCPICSKKMDGGITLIEVLEDSEGLIPTGRWFVATREFVSVSLSEVPEDQTEVFIDSDFADKLSELYKVPQNKIH